MRTQLFPDAEALGFYLAQDLLGRIAQARRDGRRFLLGCPTGRSPLPTYRAMAALLARQPQPLDALVLVMMDEYLVEADGGLAWAPPEAHFSCRGFVEREIKAPFDAALPVGAQLPAEQIWFPHPADPGAIERRIAEAGGIDFFILASGAGDGHVAFNPPGSDRGSRTRVIRLGEQTRRDNRTTFPQFRSLDEVPRHGISLGVGTIAEARASALILTGGDKRSAFQHLTAAAAYDPAWPATIITEMRDAVLLADRAAGS